MRRNWTLAAGKKEKNFAEMDFRLWISSLLLTWTYFSVFNITATAVALASAIITVKAQTAFVPSSGTDWPSTVADEGSAGSGSEAASTAASQRNITTSVAASTTTSTVFTSETTTFSQSTPSSPASTNEGVSATTGSQATEYQRFVLNIDSSGSTDHATRADEVRDILKEFCKNNDEDFCNNYRIIDYDECQHEDDNDCSVNAQCINQFGTFTCQCNDGRGDLDASTPGRTCSGDTRNVITCERDTLSIVCPDDGVISVLDANYGRRDLTTCPHSLINTDDCSSANSLEKVQMACQAKKSCDVPVTNAYFENDPCRNTYKYLSVNYTCS